MGSVVVYHFEMRSSASGQRTLSKRPATRETAQVVERAMLDASGFLPGEAPPSRG